jgi:hypothetical protein
VPQSVQYGCRAIAIFLGFWCVAISSVGPEGLRVIGIRNGLVVPACLRCWFIWPDDHKLYPAVGYGRTGGTEAERIEQDAGERFASSSAVGAGGFEPP